ncbi:SDR family NAD(P)-dependent oxidoreductase [Iamia sp.]|uniref:SDR family NAD(P)-dependent oxidoreductase n=1 Tax=Iamia sp. TaxID=2722710 RepID=UPI002B802E37|nr:SDR family NAD(P)-dependent oxidoreductase [Iamia sp.]HXH59448.1 SDR family NAD(P)-dependent oxidoreductase [Iamia sp.]
MDLGLSTRTAAVAAASAGLGLEAARALAREGVTVAICGRDRARVERAAARIGEGAVPLVADVSSPEGATDFVAQAVDALGRVDILVANAGGPPSGTFATTPLEAYLPALSLNLLSTVAMCHAAVPPMAARGWGRVVAITSASVRQPIPTLILSNTEASTPPERSASTSAEPRSAAAVISAVVVTPGAPRNDATDTTLTARPAHRCHRLPPTYEPSKDRQWQSGRRSVVARQAWGLLVGAGTARAVTVGFATVGPVTVRLTRPKLRGHGNPT